jgi:hypothetical protein
VNEFKIRVPADYCDDFNSRSIITHLPAISCPPIRNVQMCVAKIIATKSAIP